MNLHEFTRDLSPLVKTYRLSTGNSIEAGLVVVIYGTARKYDCERSEAVQEFVREWGIELEQPDMYLVGFSVDSVTTLAVAERFADTKEGIISAMKNLNETVWDQTSGRDYKLPLHSDQKDIIDDNMIAKVRKLQNKIDRKRFWRVRL